MASVFEQYPNLPGFATEFKDGGLQVRTETPTPATDSILLLGTAIDGPVGEPVAIDPNTVELVFGGATYPNGLPNGSTLVKAFYEAYQGGSRDIRLMRVTGANAVAKIQGAPVAKTVEVTTVKDLGYAKGNKTTTITLPATSKVESLEVRADGSLLVLGEDYTVATLTVTILADRLNVGAHIAAKVLVGSATVNYTDIPEVITTGDPQVIDLGITGTAKTGTLYLYANGIEVDSTSVTLAPEGKSITLAAGKVNNGATLEARFIETQNITETYEVKLESIFAGSVYNQAKVEVEVASNGVLIRITKPDSKKGQVTELPLEYASSIYPTLGQLVQAINSDARNNIVRATVSNKFLDVTTKQLQVSSVSFSNGNDGINVSKQELFTILGGNRDQAGLLTDPGVYHLLENYTVDTVIPLGVFADDELPGKYDNFASQLALACAVISHRNHATNGVIATSSPDEAGLAAIQAHVTKLLASKNDYFMRDRTGNILKDSDGRNIDLGRFISVVAGPDVILNNIRTGSYADNSAAGYGGFVAQLPVQSGPTNKVASYAKGLRFPYSNAQLDKLTEARYVTFRLKNGPANVAVVDGPTAAQANSDYRRISTTRVVKEVVNELRDVCDAYIGEPNEIPQRNAMSAAISKRLGRLVEAGVIVDYDFIIVSTPQMQLMGEAQIELTVVPPQELRKITTVVSLRPSL